MSVDKAKNYVHEKRLETKRRNFSFTLHIPERRSGKDRRSGDEHRIAPLNYIWDKERRIVIQK